MVDFTKTKIDSLIIHYVGNKVKNEDLIISKSKIELIDDIVNQNLMKYFISNFKFNNFYTFNHQSDIELNEIYTYCKRIFTDTNDFYIQSQNIARHLYEKSSHPNIKKGELYIAYFTNCIVDSKSTDVIGIFKSESKEIYLDIENNGGSFNLNCRTGININKLDKGCLIFNIGNEPKYKVSIIDMNHSDSLYWKNNFLNIKIINNEYNITSDVLKVCKKIINNDLEKAPSEKIAIINDTLNYFQHNEDFNLKEFSDDIIKIPEFEERFTSHLNTNIKSDYPNQEINNFKISEKAVSDVKRTIKNFIKLDNSVEIKICNPTHNLEQIIQKGYDEKKNMNYYKIYFKDEE